MKKDQLEILDQPSVRHKYEIGDNVMGFSMHFPVSGKIKDMYWSLINGEWEYSIENSNEFAGKIKERKILKFDPDIWNIVEAKWKRYLEILKEAELLEKECRNILKGY